MPLPDDVAADINNYVDRVMSAGREASVDYIQVDLVDRVLRPFLHIVEAAREDRMDSAVAEHAIVDLMSNLFAEFLTRVHNDHDAVLVRVHANEMMLDLARRLAVCLDHNYGPVKAPKGDTIN